MVSWAIHTSGLILSLVAPHYKRGSFGYLDLQSQWRKYGGDVSPCCICVSTLLSPASCPWRRFCCLGKVVRKCCCSFTSENLITVLFLLHSTAVAKGVLKIEVCALPHLLLICKDFHFHDNFYSQSLLSTTEQHLSEVGLTTPERTIAEVHCFPCFHYTESKEQCIECVA